MKGRGVPGAAPARLAVAEARHREQQRRHRRAPANRTVQPGTSDPKVSFAPHFSVFAAMAFNQKRRLEVQIPAFGGRTTGTSVRKANGMSISSTWQEFKNFAFKGNVVDLAVGVIIGAAFGKIVSSHRRRHHHADHRRGFRRA